MYANRKNRERTTCADFAQVADNEKTYHYKFYSLATILAACYRINSTSVSEFRQWATRVLETFAKQGYVLDKNRLINGKIFDDEYFDHLISEIQVMNSVMVTTATIITVTSLPLSEMLVSKH